MFNEGSYNVIIVLPIHFNQFFGSSIVRHVVDVCKSGMPCFLHRPTIN